MHGIPLALPLALLAAVAVLFAGAAHSVHVTVDNGQVVNRNVERTIDLTGQNVKITHKITLIHKKQLLIDLFIFTMTYQEHQTLAHISIKDSAKKEVKFTESEGSEGMNYVAQLPTAQPNQSPVFYVETVFTQAIAAFPAEIAQSEKQLVRYYGSAYHFSIYQTIAQKTTILLSSKNVESYTTVKPSSLNEATLTYGPYDNVPGEFERLGDDYFAHRTRLINK